jgi:tRNA A-37 threonylcarbamoyl transferase component Bud32/streptogramin lyase
MTTESPDEDRLLDLLMRWEELRNRGRAISVEELARDSPHLQAELRKRITALTATAWLEKPLDDEDPPEADYPAPSTSAPKIFGGRYRLDAILAEGGFAQVWKGTDLELKRVVAIKIPKPSRLQSAESFISEAQRVARLKHPGVVPVFDVGREGAVCFIVSEYVEGGSLKSVLATNRPAEDCAIRWMCEIAEALHHAHEQGVIHRDVKPANILIDRHGRAMLADFGIAQSPLKAAKSVGTVRYMSPEQLAGAPADKRADVFSLGVVLHEVLTGSLPYPGSPSLSIPVAVERGLPRAVAAGVPRPLRAVIGKALQHDPGERYQSAAEMGAAVRSAIRRQKDRRRLVKGCVVLSALAVVAAVIPLAIQSIRSLRPQLRASGLVDWRINGNHVAETLESIKQCAISQAPRLNFIAAQQVDYQQHGGGVCLPDGRVLCMPSPAGVMVMLDPSTGTVERIASPEEPKPAAFFGAVLAPNGCVYGMPHYAQSFLKVDPRTKECRLFGESPGDRAYWGGVVAPNGRIYGIPSTASNVVEIDPETDSVTTFGDLPGDGYKYSGGVLAPNGRIYCMPDHARRFMVIDPDDRTVAYLDHDLGEGAAKTFGGVLAPNGKIYSGLAGAGKVWVIDPADDSIEVIAGLPDGLRYVGGVLGPDGKIYCVPSRQVPLFVIDPETHECGPIAGSPVLGSAWGAVLTTHGSIVLVPWDATRFTTIDFGVRVPRDWALSRLFNRF